MVRLLIKEQVDAISRAVGVTDLVLPKPFSLAEVRRTWRNCSTGAVRR